MKNIIIGLDMDIVPGKSIGGISLGENINEIIQRIECKYSIAKSIFSNNTGNYSFYRVQDGAISFTTNNHDVIVSLWCEPPYSGSFKGKLYPGITAREIREKSKRQDIIKGYLVIDQDFTIYFGMPDDIDDFNSFPDLDDEVVFNELYVGDLK
ncbi:hypothetical protein [Pectobacterium parmentieri]|uniref:hypothetical protein n=1 Tax=Pectobacterium parmentieri TaxID=1905730 RepID=UPI0006764121|nr:hypothetical protein [Pectobacterium parmentieri]PWD68134.1 hypothetical protein DF211_00805 [Pectobacterium parmentieri]